MFECIIAVFASGKKGMNRGREREAKKKQRKTCRHCTRKMLTQHLATGILWATRFQPASLFSSLSLHPRMLLHCLTFSLWRFFSLSSLSLSSARVIQQPGKVKRQWEWAFLVPAVIYTWFSGSLTCISFSFFSVCVRVCVCRMHLWYNDMRFTCTQD